MKTLETLKLLFFITVFTSQMNGQEVEKKIVVEHFTNTRCGICANRNPGFYAALNQKPKVLHVAYHPSSPYSNCLFSTQNKAENDERTRFYDVYGGTPRFLINGEEKSSTAMQNISVYTPFENQTTPIRLTIGLLPSGIDSIKVNITVSAVAPHSLTNLSLYVPLLEDVVTYAAPNGEGNHYDVFRKSFTGINPISFTPPSHNGVPYNYTATVAKNSIWNLDKLYALAIVQEEDKSIVQTEASPLFDKNAVSSTDQEINSDLSFIISPNPANDIIFINSHQNLSFSSFTIHDISGKIVMNPSISNIQNGIDITMLPKGTFLVKVDRKDGKQMVSKFIKH